MIGIYFSGTGNTKYCIEKFISIYNSSIKAIALENITTLNKIKKEHDIILAYPIYYSNLPKILWDFIKQNKMPDCICDVKVLKRSNSENKKIIKNANNKLKQAVQMLKNGKPPKEGLNFSYHLAGLFGQRLWFLNKTRYYSSNLHIDKNACIKCGKCISLCPMKNLIIQQEEVYNKGKCTMCYHCINQCPQKAITLIGHRVITQKNLNDYIN